jgi:hypothetical protein
MELMSHKKSVMDSENRNNSNSNYNCTFMTNCNSLNPFYQFLVVEYIISHEGVIQFQKYLTEHGVPGPNKTKLQTSLDSRRKYLLSLKNKLSPREYTETLQNL